MVEANEFCEDKMNKLANLKDFTKKFVRNSSNSSAFTLQVAHIFKEITEAPFIT